MRAWDSVTQGGSLRAGPASLAVLTAGLLLSLSSISRPVENFFYDFLQRIQSTTPNGAIVLVDSRDLKTDSPWESQEMPAFLEALARYNPRILIVAEPTPLSAGLPDSAQLATLADLERRSRESDPAAAPAADPRRAAFRSQLDEMQRRSELQARIVRAAGEVPGLLLAIPTFDGSRNSPTRASTCAKHVIDVRPGESSEIEARRVRAVTAPSDELCKVALGAGHAEFWPDADGIVRRHELLVNASGALVPSVALRAAIEATATDDRAARAVNDLVPWDPGSVRTTSGMGTLMRYYPPGHSGTSAFDSATVEEIVRGRLQREKLAGRIVILGHAGGDSDITYASSIDERVAPVTMLATALSNLLDRDYLVRPSWMPPVEFAAMVLMGFAILVWGGRLPPALAVMAGIVTGVALLGLEAFLFLEWDTWAALATPATFAVSGMVLVHLLQRRMDGKAIDEPQLAAALAVGPASPPVRDGEDELDSEFSKLRHQPTSDRVKQRLYDVALGHARRRDLAKAERVLRHLASIDPDYRQAGSKLKKLAGLREAVQSPPAPSTARPAPSILQPPREPADLSGRTIGRYEIEQPIGRGAMATVYLGRDPKINRRVAIKTIALAEEFTDSDLANARTQFLREAESAGRLNHPNIISIYDAGEDDQVAYLAMEYFAGTSLSSYAQQGHLLPPKLVFELMARAADALHYAHGQHVVHRDVKPANLLYDRSTDTLKITDFGIARLTDTSRTKTGIILGTPSYMSPEQLAGTNVTGQSDLFSLGVTLYQLLTGMAPFRADSIPRLMQKIAHERHEPLRALRDDLPPCADEILDRALAKDPSGRYPSGRSMALALRDCCSSFEPSSAAAST